MQDNGDCLLDCYHNDKGINLVFCNLDIDVYYQWIIHYPAIQLYVSSPAKDNKKTESFFPRRKIVGLRSGYYTCDEYHCRLMIHQHDDGVRLICEDHQMDLYYYWKVDDKKVSKFQMGTACDLDGIIGW